MDSEDDSDNSSPVSSSPPASPLASSHGPPSVERVVQHFVSAKRSLSSTHYVWRANELVTSSRSLIEEIAVLNARSTFARRSVDEEVATLYNIRDGVVGAGDDASEEFRGTIQELDLANDRLQRTLNVLRKTVVDASLQNAGSDVEIDNDSSITNGGGISSSTSENSDEKTLYDFIDESSHTTLQTSLRGLIDSFNESRADFDTTISHFDESLKTISGLLADKTSDPADKSTLYDEPPPTIAHLFRSMEDHATELATLLQSLVAHYDLCVTALNHTEGGGEAAKRAIQQAEEALTQGVEESLYLKTGPEPISEAEKTEMLRVLENDAQEVEDVVGEIKERTKEQESQYEQLSRHVKKARSTNQTLRRALDMLHEMKDIQLPSHLDSLTTFQSSWTRIQSSMQSQTAELASLSSFYDGFLSGYAKLLREVDRRKTAEEQMRKVAEKAKKEMSRLFEADREARRDFMDETGKFLPQGIWPGLMSEGVRWQVQEVRPE